MGKEVSQIIDDLRKNRYRIDQVGEKLNHAQKVIRDMEEKVHLETKPDQKSSMTIYEEQKA